MEPVRVGSIGLGRWGDTLAEKGRSAGLELVSCYSPSDRKQAFAQKHGCRPAETLDALLADPEIEAVLVATPHSTHADIAEQAAAAGKHLFIDKPFTLTVADARRAIAAAEKTGVVLQVGHNRRRQPATRQIKQLVDRGDLGVVHHVEANLSYPKGLNPRTGWRGDPAESPAGGMTGLGVHMVDNLIYIVGHPARVAAFSKQVIAVGTLDDVTTVNLEFEDGPLGFIGTSMVIPDVAKTAAFGTEGAAWNETDGARFYRQAVGEPERHEEPVDTLDTVRDELVEFAECVRTGAAPEVGGPEGLEVVAVLQAIVESAATRRVVELDEVRAG